MYLYIIIITFIYSFSDLLYRSFQAALTERVSTYVHGDPSKSGIPTKELCNMYEKYSHGGFGMLLTGNIVVDPVGLKEIEMIWLK